MAVGHVSGNVLYYLLIFMCQPGVSLVTHWYIKNSVCKHNHVMSPIADLPSIKS